uniref:Uncharacterized protein n=1 Tax=Panagrolaimus davidi TaxID=227884 RepID=A0A914QC80_9BILA
MFNKTNVDIVSLKENPIIEIKPNGILTSDGKLHEIDILALATGYDFAGSLLKIGLADINGIPLSEHWLNGTKTFQRNFNFKLSKYVLYLWPQAPTAFSNGPTLIEIQAD